VQEQGCHDQCNTEIANAVAEYEGLDALPASEMFRYLYAELPLDYQAQLAEVKQLYG